MRNASYAIDTLEQVSPPSLPLLLEVSPPLLRLGDWGSALAPPAGPGEPGRQMVFGEFQAKNLASSSNDHRDHSDYIALILNALPPKFLQKRFPHPYFFHGAFAPSFIWSRRP